MSKSNGLVLADDATGALECASLLAGFQTVVSLSTSEVTPGIRVIDTETRHLSPANAARRIRQCLTPMAYIFKKTDSTLRGNIGAELAALIESGPVVYIPAYPALGRTVHDGTLYVHGIPVAETEFGNDAREPVRSSRIADVFPAALRHLLVAIPNADALANALNGSSAKILVCDAASDDDLDRLAAVLETTAPRPHVASPAGFIKAWAAIGGFERHAAPGFPQPRKWLVVCGSRHPQSRRQSSIAEASGLPVIQSGMDAAQTPDLVSTELARRAIAVIERQSIDAVIIMGGDTVRAVWRAMGLDGVIPLPEVFPGIAASFSPNKSLLFVTKAGGFGDDRLIERIMERFKQA